MSLSRTIIVIALIVLAGCTHASSTFEVNNGLLVENVTIISANKNGILEKYVGHVLLDDEVILYSGKQKPSVSGHVKIIQGEGKFIIPGLIDSHVHLANVAGMTWQNQRDHPELAKSYFNQLPKSYLYYGFTTLIDVNNYAPDIVAEIKNQAIRPDIFTCGQQVQVMNDFMMAMEELPLKARLKYPFLYDKYIENIQFPDSIDLELHSPEAIVRSIAEQQQGIGVKIVYEDESSGFPQTWELPSLSLMRDLVEQSRKEGIPVLMHAPSLEGQKFGLESGIDIFAHPMWSWYINPYQFLDTLFTEEHQEVLQEIATKKIGNQLTFRAIYGEVDLLTGNFNSDPALADVYPKAYLNWLKTDEGNWGKQKIVNRAKIVKAINPTLYNFLRPQFETDEAMFRGIQEVFKIRMNTVAKFLADHDAKLLFGTDGVAMNMSTNPPGYNGFLEMQHWVKAGIPLEKIFIAATYNNANAFHIDDKYGTIEKGKIANLLLLNEDPLQSISAYTQINTVIVHGKAHSRNTLSANSTLQAQSFTGQIAFGKTTFNYSIKLTDIEDQTRAFFSSLEMNAFEIPCQNTTFEKDSLKFDVISDFYTYKYSYLLQPKSSKGQLKVYSNETEQLVNTFETDLTREDIPESDLIKNQEVNFTSNGLELSGTLWNPKNPNNKGLLFVTSSQGTDRSGTNAEAYYFAGLGYTVFHYDKRGTGKSEGDWQSATLEELCSDDINALEFFSQISSISLADMGIKGSSQGGIKIPFILSKMPDLGFGISVSCPGGTLLESDLNYWRNVNYDQIGKANMDRAQSVQKAGYEYLAGNISYPSMLEIKNENLNEDWLKYVWFPERDVQKDYKLNFSGLPYFEKISQPILVIQGLSDQVIPEDSFRIIENALKKSKSKAFKIRTLENTTHSMTYLDKEYPYFQLRTPEYLEVITQWLKTVETR